MAKKLQNQGLKTAALGTPVAFFRKKLTKNTSNR